MLKKWISRYRNIFDVQIHNSTLIVLVISGLICMIGSLSTPNQSYAQSLKTSTLEGRSEEQQSIVTLHGKKYRVIFSEVNN